MLIIQHPSLKQEVTAVYSPKFLISCTVLRKSCNYITLELVILQNVSEFWVLSSKMKKSLEVWFCKRILGILWTGHVQKDL